jgi:hypothetical protein
MSPTSRRQKSTHVFLTTQEKVSMNFHFRISPNGRVSPIRETSQYREITEYLNALLNITIDNSNKFALVCCKSHRRA